MLATVSTSWPGSRLTVSGAMRCAESATATARWRSSSASVDRRRRRAASGWCGATAKTNVQLAQRSCTLDAGRRSRPRDATPMARSAWPVTSASQVPASTSVRRRRRVAGGSRRLPRGRRGAAERVEGLAQLEHRGARDHAVDGDRELRLPAGGDARTRLATASISLQQARGLRCSSSLAGGGELRLARAAVEQQHVERVLELAHAVGQRRRHLAELARGRGEAAGARDGVHHRQRVGGQGVAVRGLMASDAVVHLI